MQPNDNDIVYNQYGLDLMPIFEFIGQLISGGTLSGESIAAFFASAWTIFSVIAFFFSLLFIVGIIYSYLKINEYVGLFSDKVVAAHEEWKQRFATPAVGSRWQEVEAHVRSERPNDWKLAIIEADIMLGNALSDVGYAGTSIGEQLKSISPTQLTSLQDAWDAHLVRNKIAHEGGDFVFTQNDAQQTLVKFERVLRELGAL